MNALQFFKKKIAGWTIGITGFLILVAIPLYAWKVSEKTDYTDFDVYYRAAVRSQSQLWGEVYNLNDGASPFRYAPIFLPFFRPFAELPLSGAKLLWYFLQLCSFAGGFHLILRSLQLSNPHFKKQDLLFWTSISLLFVLRFCLDTFTIGQCSSFLFLGFCGGLYAWMNHRSIWVSLSLLIPTLFKIGPGFLFGVFLAGTRRELIRGVTAAILSSAILYSASAIWFGSLKLTHFLWRSWAEVVIQDSSYYDASHYGSQSFKSFLLRSKNFGYLSSELAHIFYLLGAILVIVGIATFWILRRPQTLHARGLFFSLGLFVYIWIMPETFKYSLTPLAIPIAFLVSSIYRTKLTYISLSIGALTLSLAGKDLIPEWIFFNNQIYSLPFFSTLLLGAAVFELAWRDSVASPLASNLSQSYQRRMLKR